MAWFQWYSGHIDPKKEQFHIDFVADELPGLKRDMEFAMMDELVSQCKKQDKEINRLLLPTAKTRW